MKGDSEAHPFLSPDDEFADYETWDAGNASTPMVPKQDSMLQYEYARSALRLGIQLEDELGANPFKFGMIGSTDTTGSRITVRVFGGWAFTPDEVLRHDFARIGYARSVPAGRADDAVPNRSSGARSLP